MKTFYYLLANTLLVSVINFTVWFAITFFIFLQTRSVFATGMLSGIYLVFTTLTGIWFGSLVDNHKKKTVMIISSMISLVLYAICLAIYLLAPAASFTQVSNPMLWIFVLILMVGVGVGNIRNIALPTTITILIPAELRDKANGLSGSAAGMAFLVTSVISGLLVGHSGMYWVLILAVVFTAASILHMWTIKIPEKNVLHTEEHTKKIDIRGTIKAVAKISGLFPLIFFTTINNFLGGVFMALMDAYGLSLVSVQVWGFLWGILSTGFIIGGLIIAKWGLGKNPLRALFIANLIIWTSSSVFTLYPSIILLAVGMYVYLCVVPYIEAAEQTIIQRVVPAARQGRVFGFAQTVESAAAPITAFMIGPITQFIFIPFMTTGSGVELIGDWFGTGQDRGIALVFTLTGLLGLALTTVAMRSQFAKDLAKRFTEAK